MFDLKLIKVLFEKHKNFFFAGCDEVGRGPLAGPVVGACASIDVLDNNFESYEEIKSLIKKWKKLGITDSKKLNSKERSSILSRLTVDQIDLLRANQNYIIYSSKNLKVTINIQEISASRIDQINILQASLEAMKVAMLESSPLKKEGLVLIDGNKTLKLENLKINQIAVVKGDTKSLLIGLASIFAKEYRDRLMIQHAHKYPQYGWENNSGYPTKRHLEAINEFGITELHRLTFRGVKEVYEERGIN